MAAEKNRRKNRFMIPLVLVLALAASCAAFSGVYAKYIKTVDEGTGMVTSKVMYFESDYLTEQGARYTITGDSVIFQLRNYPDELRVSELDVNYTVTVTGGATIKIDTEAKTSGTLAAGSKSAVSVEISDLQPGQTYTVTAVGTNGYTKMLSATFTVKATEDKVFKRVEQTEHYVLLTVWTQNVTGGATITVPAGLIPDNTDPVLANVKTSIEGNLAIFSDEESFVAAYSSRTYRFFKSTNTTYAAADFTVTVTSEENNVQKTVIAEEQTVASGGATP